MELSLYIINKNYFEILHLNEIYFFIISHTKIQIINNLSLCQNY
jgi:hypothetical protein